MEISEEAYLLLMNLGNGTVRIPCRYNRSELNEYERELVDAHLVTPRERGFLLKRAFYVPSAKGYVYVLSRRFEDDSR